MERRRSFRPRVDEPLEDRLVLSRAAGAWPGSLQAAGGRTQPNLASAQIQQGPVGVLGDDYSDEYKFYPPVRSQARNWVEILHSLRDVSFGPFSLASRGAPRNQGFEYDWAQSGATSSDMIRTQLPGLTQQVASGQIRYAAIFIGTNDFFQFLEGVQLGVIPPTQALPVLTEVTTQAVANVATATQTILAANPVVSVVLFTIPDVTLAPLARSMATTPQAQLLLSATSQAIGQFNASITALGASSPRVAVADLAAATAQAATSPTGTITFGGQTINLLTPGNNYHDFFLADGAHVGTVGQGIIADLFTLTLAQKLGGQTFPPTPQEIIPYARSVQVHANRPNSPP